VEDWGVFCPIHSQPAPEVPARPEVPLKPSEYEWKPRDNVVQSRVVKGLVMMTALYADKNPHQIPPAKRDKLGVELEEEARDKPLWTPKAYTGENWDPRAHVQGRSKPGGRRGAVIPGDIGR